MAGCTRGASGSRPQGLEGTELPMGHVFGHYPAEPPGETEGRQSPGIRGRRMRSGPATLGEPRSRSFVESGPNGKGAAGSLGVWLLTGSMPGGGGWQGCPSAAVRGGADCPSLL